jgi:hypothetical protein
MRALRGEDFAIEQSDLEFMDVLIEELRTALLKGLSPEEVLRRCMPEELAEGLSDEQVDRLRELLELRQDK